LESDAPEMVHDALFLVHGLAGLSLQIPPPALISISQSLPAFVRDPNKY
jgi:hypothetical protein